MTVMNTDPSTRTDFGSFDVIGVVDIAEGRAVHARGGVRDRYETVKRIAGVAIPDGNPVAVVGTYVDMLGIGEIYVADLDAIGGKPIQAGLISSLSGFGVRLWLDAGIRSADDATRAGSLGVSRVIVGMETLRSFNALDEIVRRLGRERVAFSLDLRRGHPVSPPDITASRSPLESAVAAAGSGAGALIVIDLARVGAGTGVDHDLIRKIRSKIPDRTLIAGGGIRHRRDLESIAAAGADGALVATALHSGNIGHSDVEAMRVRNAPER